MTYCVVCPDIDPLTSAAADFFQQLGTGEFYRYWTVAVLTCRLKVVILFSIFLCGNLLKLID